MINGTSGLRAKYGKLSLERILLNESDSITFLFKFRRDSFLTNKVSYGRLSNGGYVAFGFVDDFANEKQIFLKDPGEYFHHSKENLLYDILMRSKENDLESKGKLFFYAVLKSNNTAVNNIRYEFRN